MKLTDFPLRALINLDRRKDRIEQSESHLKKIGLSFHRYSAIAPNEDMGYENPARRGCNLSHRMILEEARSLRFSSVLIMEDDVQFNPRINEIIANVELPKKWAVIYFGALHREPPTGGGILRYCTRSYDRHCYCVNKSYYDVAIDSLTPYKNDAFQYSEPGTKKLINGDQVFAQLQRLAPCFCFVPNLAWQRHSFSDLTGQEKSLYREDGSQAFTDFKGIL